MLDNMLGDPGHIRHTGEHNPALDFNQARAWLADQALLQGDPLSGVGLSKNRNPQVSVTDPKELHCESEPIVAPKDLAVDFFNLGIFLLGMIGVRRKETGLGVKGGGDSKRGVDREVSTSLHPTRDSASQFQDPEGS